MRDQFGTAYCGVGSKSSGDVIHICYMSMEKKHIPADKHYQEYGRNPHIVMSPTFAVNQQNSANRMPEMENRHHHPNCVPKIENRHHHPNCVPKMENSHHHPNCVPQMENSHHHPNCVPETENCHHHPNCVPKMENSHHHPNCVPKVENCHHHPNCVPKMENCHHHPNCVPKMENSHHHHCANSVPEVEDCHKHTKDCRLDGCHCSVKCDCKCVEDVCTKYLRKELCKFIGKPIYIVIKGNFIVGLTIIITRVECGIIEGIVTSPAPWVTTSQGQNSANTNENNLYEYPSMVFQICSIISFSPNYQADAYWQGQGISQSQK